ncbi:TPA: DarT ssDNA thymidine ADP-ribosyltransferase family protein [Photobacterium damselae]
MSVEQVVSRRNIEEVLHFTTNYGLVGTFSVGKVLSRDQLATEEALEYITKYNSRFRSDDPRWIPYVNLSISRINASFFGYSQNWHRDENDFWVILSFSSEILKHDGVVFTTTNNIYNRQCRRASGAEGLEQMFQQAVLSKNSQQVTRTPLTPNNWTTCGEAEVLYPSSIDLKYLNKLYVRDENTYILAQAALSFNENLQDIVIEVNDDKFKGL